MINKKKMERGGSVKLAEKKAQVDAKAKSAMMDGETRKALKLKKKSAKLGAKQLKKEYKEAKPSKAEMRKLKKTQELYKANPKFAEEDKVTGTNQPSMQKKKGGTLGYQPTAKYGKVTKASMYMSGGELKMYKKRKK